MKIPLQGALVVSDFFVFWLHLAQRSEGPIMHETPGLPLTKQALQPFQLFPFMHILPQRVPALEYCTQRRHAYLLGPSCAALSPLTDQV